MESCAEVEVEDCIDDEEVADVGAAHFHVVIGGVVGVEDHHRVVAGAAAEVFHKAVVVEHHDIYLPPKDDGSIADGAYGDVAAVADGGRHRVAADADDYVVGVELRQVDTPDYAVIGQHPRQLDAPGGHIYVIDRQQRGGGLSGRRPRFVIGLYALSHQIDSMPRLGVRDAITIAKPRLRDTEISDYAVNQPLRDRETA